MSRFRIFSVVMVGCGLWANNAWSQLTVIYDSGVTRPLAPFFEAFSETPRSNAIDLQSTLRPSLGAADLTRLLPIRTPGLTPGWVTWRPLRMPKNGTLTRPFFLIGSDSRSRDWFRLHRDRLQAISAVGMLIQADTEDDLTAIAEIADGIPILPTAATDIARILDLEHIPVLVSRRGIEQ